MTVNRLSIVVRAALLLGLCWLAACSGGVPLDPAPSSPAPAVQELPAGPTHTPVETPPASAAQPAEALQPAQPTCSPSAPDALGPFYTPGAPVRNQVGQGYVLQGVVRSSEDCQPIPGAQLEFWLAGPDGEYADAYRATTFAGEDGSYRFESHPPPPYSGRPPHIHILASAPGYQALVTQHYPREGDGQADFDLVLAPED